MCFPNIFFFDSVATLARVLLVETEDFLFLVFILLWGGFLTRKSSSFTEFVTAKGKGTDSKFQGRKKKKRKKKEALVSGVPKSQQTHLLCGEGRKRQRFFKLAIQIAKRVKEALLLPRNTFLTGLIHSGAPTSSPLAPRSPLFAITDCAIFPPCLPVSRLHSR